MRLHVPEVLTERDRAVTEKLAQNLVCMFLLCALLGHLIGGLGKVNLPGPVLAGLIVADALGLLYFLFGCVREALDDRD